MNSLPKKKLQAGEREIEIWLVNMACRYKACMRFKKFPGSTEILAGPKCQGNDWLSRHAWWCGNQGSIQPERGLFVLSDRNHAGSAYPSLDQVILSRFLSND